MSTRIERSTAWFYVTLSSAIGLIGLMLAIFTEDIRSGIYSRFEQKVLLLLLVSLALLVLSLWYARKAIPVQAAEKVRGFEPLLKSPQPVLPSLQSPSDSRTIPGMSDFIKAYIEEHAATAKQVAEELSPKIELVGKLLCDAFAGGKKVLTFGNGGSAADAQHLAEEMIGRFQRNRRALPAISLNSDGTALTCIANDYGFEEIFARQVTALANPGDIVIGLSTSGNSENVLRALKAAKNKGAITVALLGRGGGKIAPHCDHALIVPGAQTANAVQEMHVMMVHLLCEIVDRWAEKG